MRERVREIDDRALVDAIVAGEDGAGAELFRRHRDSVRRCAQSIVRDQHDAEDIVQIVMARAITAIPRDRPRRLRPWLEAIARNEALMLLRSRAPREALNPEHPAAGTVDGAFALREEIAGLVVDLSHLPERQRTALVLRHLYEMSYRQIGELLGIRPGTARQAVLQARRSLISRADARDQDCADIRLLLTGDGRTRRAVMVRAHLDACASCRASAPATIGQRIRGLLPLPEPMLPPVLLRVLGGPGTTLRTGGAAAACVCMAIGIGMVGDAKRGGEPAPGGDLHAAVQPPDRSGRLPATERKQAGVRGVRRTAERRVVQAPQSVTGAAPQAPAPAAAAPAPAASNPGAHRPEPSDTLNVLPEDGNRKHVSVQLFDETTVHVYFDELNGLVPEQSGPIVGPDPIPNPVELLP